MLDLSGALTCHFFTVVCLLPGWLVDLTVLLKETGNQKQRWKLWHRRSANSSGAVEKEQHNHYPVKKIKKNFSKSVVYSFREFLVCSLFIYFYFIFYRMPEIFSLCLYLPTRVGEHAMCNVLERMPVAKEVPGKPPGGKSLSGRLYGRADHAPIHPGHKQRRSFWAHPPWIRTTSYR